MLSKLRRSSRPRNARCRAFDFGFLARFRKDTCGGVLIYTAFMLPVILGVSGLAVDTSLWYGNKRGLQAMADVAALSAALEMTRINDETLAKTAAKADAVSNGLDEAEGDTLEINTPPKYGSFAGQNGMFEAIVTRPVPTFLARLVYPDQVIVAARAVATVAGSSVPCVLALEENDKDAIKVNNGSFFANGCKVQVNSSDSKALHVFNNASMTGDEINIVGGYQNQGYISSEPNTGMPTAGDPFSGLSAPSFSGCDHNNLAFDSGTHVLSEGVYCGGITLSGSASVEFEPGMHIMQDGGFSASGNTSVVGEEVTVYMAGDSAISVSGQADIDLSAPMTGDYAGMLLYGDPNASTNVQHQITGNGNLTYNGFMYFPTAELKYNGNGLGSTADYTAVIARILRFGGNGELHFMYDPDDDDVPTIPGGATVTLVE